MKRSPSLFLSFEDFPIYLKPNKRCKTHDFNCGNSDKLLSRFKQSKVYVPPHKRVMERESERIVLSDSEDDESREMGDEKIHDIGTYPLLHVEPRVRARRSAIININDDIVRNQIPFWNQTAVAYMLDAITFAARTMQGIVREAWDLLGRVDVKRQRWNFFLFPFRI